MQHDDLLGEAVISAEGAEVQDTVMRAVYQVPALHCVTQAVTLCAVCVPYVNHHHVYNMMRHCMQVGDVPNPPRFPGSQPVSLARANWNLLALQRFWVTWKADGTRYMLFVCKWGVYTIDRAFRVRRTQMRFINPRSSTR